MFTRMLLPMVSALILCGSLAINQLKKAGGTEIKLVVRG
jgi:hypothetical protein